MNYLDTVNWMFNQLPMYQKKGKTAYKEDLSNTLLLTNHLKHPETKFKSIHVAGTNGKGSTSHMLASIFQEAGYTVGLYTSPHLKDFRERIKINGKQISKQFVIQFIEQNKAFFENNSLSFFEMTVGMAFDYFVKKKVDIAIVEVGLGGRLDSTNVLSPEVSVITNIGLDHMQFLGTTLKEIALEKGGIIKPSTSVVIGETQTETEPIFRNIAIKNKASIYFADQLIEKEYPSDLQGVYQKHNIKTAIQTVYEARKRGFKISNSNIKDGLLSVIKNTKLNGRWQVLQEEPKIICDTAHNKEGLNYTMKQLNEEIFNKLHLVIGVVNDKSLNTIIDLFPENAIYYFCKPAIPRGLDANVLKHQFENKNRVGEAYNSVNEALNSAKNAADKTDVIYIGGSTFVVAEII
ncbi:bifunctional folylpolyglutamate synthase/dihydrofolate synthase [Flavobacteriaceae bacterium AU392]|nr:bifunctional folylpolyglutamate synthase/dihydrofolate synthase [Flavobacteriaceae bacterium]RKM82633.1 bifunctional folylpolyglutamate synthase/dihydrofolate synthase [Flavobacteriaceae bacterium AU392]